MEDKILKHARKKGRGVQKQQGGTVLNAGPKSANAPKVSGDHANPTFYTRQDGSREQGGGVKNPFHEV